MREVEGAAEAVVGPVAKAHDQLDDDRTTDSNGAPELARAPHGLATSTDGQSATAFPVLAPPGACRYLQLDGVRRASCLALEPAIPLAPRQVELVCLGAAHADCPRFVRAGGDEPVALAPSGPPSAGQGLGGVQDPDGAQDPADTHGRPPVQSDAPSVQVDRPSVRLGHTVGSLHVRPQARRSRGPRPAMLLATGALAAATVFAIGFAALRGGLVPSVGQVPAASTASAAVSGAAAAASVGPSSSLAASGGPLTPSPSAGVAAASASPPVKPSSGSPLPAPSPDRMALLTPCPDQPDCYQYRIRRHDNLRGIAAFFGVPYRTVLDLNPQIKNPSLIHVGQIIILPPPGP